MAKDDVNERILDLEHRLEQMQDKIAANGGEQLHNIEETLQVLARDHQRRVAGVQARLQSINQPAAIDLRRDDARPFQIARRLSNPDELAVRALNEVKGLQAYQGGEAGLRQLIVQRNGLGTAITRLTSALNASGALDETDRLLLSDPDIYGTLVLQVAGRVANNQDAINKFGADKEGFRITINELLNADDGPRHRFVRVLGTAALKRGGVVLDPHTLVGGSLIAELRAHPVALGSGRVESAVELAYERLLGEGVFPRLVDAYVSSREIDADKFTPEIRKAMVRHLIARGVRIDLNDAAQADRFLEGGYDEYFALAYDQAASSAAGDDDPIVVAATKGATVAPWDFTVDTFESIEEQGVVKENILAAGALDYVWELGERLGIFRLADALTLNWAAGAIDVVDGPCAAKLYRYWKLRDQRSDPTERGLVYKRVLNKGDVEALARMVVNENFEDLRGALCEKVVEYRAKVEEATADKSDSLLVSRAPIHQALRDLQYNLTEFCTGMAHMQVREMYSQLRDAMDLLGDPEIIDHFGGGRRKTMWTVIERLSKSEYGEAPNINAIRIAAVEGNAMFRFIANFAQGAVSEEQFQAFIDSTEAWIIAKGSDDTTVAPAHDDEDDEDEDDAFDDEDA